MDSNFEVGILNEIFTMIMNYEYKFSQNNYKGRINGDITFDYKSSNSNILIVTPHAVLTKKDKIVSMPDKFTGSLGSFINVICDCWFLYPSKYYDINKYGKEYIINFAKNNDIEIIIEIIGDNSIIDVNNKGINIYKNDKLLGNVDTMDINLSIVNSFGHDNPTYYTLKISNELINPYVDLDKYVDLASSISNAIDSIANLNNRRVSTNE